MRILLFPTRYYPAISGGDFSLQRVAEELQKPRKRGANYHAQYQANQVHVFTSNAIDFAALHGVGKVVTAKHKHFTSYRNISITRFAVASPSTNLAQEKQTMKSLFYHSFPEFSQKSNSFLIQCLENGPILPELHHIIHNRTSPIELMGFSPDAIHCSYLPYNNLLYALILGNLWSIPVFVTPFLHFENSRYQDSSLYQIMNLFSGIFACTPHERQIFLNNGVSSSKVYVIPMGVDFHKFKLQNNKIPQLTEVLPVTHPLVLFCGYKNFEKGALTLLHAIPKVLTRRSEINFLFIGPASKAYNYELKNLRKEHPKARIFNLTPNNLSGVLDPKKIGAFQFADIFCMPSRSDAYGIVYLEAWATKTPVIAANTPQMQDVISHNESGMLVPFNDSEILATTILELIENESLRNRLGEKGYEKTVPAHSWLNITQMYFKKYLQVKTTRTN